MGYFRNQKWATRKKRLVKTVATDVGKFDREIRKFLRIGKYAFQKLSKALKDRKMLEATKKSVEPLCNNV